MVLPTLVNRACYRVHFQQLVGNLTKQLLEYVQNRAAFPDNAATGFRRGDIHSMLFWAAARLVRHCKDAELKAWLVRELKREPLATLVKDYLADPKR